MNLRIFAILVVLIASGMATAANVIISPNMGMPVPVVGTDPGPDWANNINASLSIVDSHDHTAGHGVQIPPAGLNINSDLTFQSNNATSLRSTRFTAQGSPLAGASDLGAVYVSGVDLYYNDVSGNQVRITQGGSVTGSTGTITGLPSGTASASFAASTFTFQSATNTPAIMAVGPVKIGTNAVSPKTVTLAPPGGLAANYNLTFPNGLPGSTSLLSVDVSGNMASVAETGTGSAVLASGPSIANLTLTGQTLSANGSGGAPAYGFSSSTNSGVYSSASNVVSVAAAGNKVLDIAAAGVTVTGGTTINGTGGNTPHACTTRTASSTISVTSTCNAGEIVTGGGCQNTPGNITDNRPSGGISWFCSQSGGGVSITAFAICCSI